MSRLIFRSITLTLVFLVACVSLSFAQSLIRAKCPSPAVSQYGIVQVSGGNGNITFIPCPSKKSIFSGIVDLSGATVISPAQWAATAFSAGDGSSFAPSYRFTNSSTTGLYSTGANQIGFSINGTNKGTWTNTGLTVVGTLAATTVTATNPIDCIGCTQVTSQGSSTATNATSTMANTSMSLTLAANTKYALKCFWTASDATAADGWKFDFNGGTISSGSTTVFISAAGSGSSTSFPDAAATSIAASIATASIANAAATAININGVIATVTGGTLVPRFAKNAVTSGNANLFAHSYCTATRLN